MVKELPSFLPVMKLDDKDLDQYVGVYKRSLNLIRHI